MFTRELLFVVYLCGGSALSSHYHGPTALPQVLHNGYLADTNDVAAAKSAHLATHAHQSHGYVNTHNSHESEHSHNGDLRYHGPTAAPQVLHNGYLANTHDVAAANSAHLATLAHQSNGYVNTHNSHDSEQSHNGDLRYHGPTAIPHVLRNGHIADTREVAAAKAAHLRAVEIAKAQVRYRHSYSVNSGKEHNGGYRYHGLIANPNVLDNRHITDTHEVASAKGAHFDAIATAKTHGGYGHGYSGESEHRHQGDYKYQGPIAIPNVSHNGHIADTHDVAASKDAHYDTKAQVGYGHSYSVESGKEHNGDYKYHGNIANLNDLQNGHIADTHDVAAAKDADFDPNATFKSDGGHSHDYSGDSGHEHRGDYRYQGPIAIPNVLHNGHIAETLDIAAAKDAVFDPNATTKSHGGYSHGYSGDSGHGHRGNYRYQGPIAIPNVLYNGHIADTHDVAAAKDAHADSIATAKSDGGYSHNYSGDSGHGHRGGYRYQGPIAIPNVSHNGHIAFTHDVAAANDAHFDAIAIAKAQGWYSHGYSGDSGHRHRGDYRYQGPTAIPYVLDNGHIADTREVAAAKDAHLAAVATAKAQGGNSSSFSEQHTGGYDHGTSYGAHHAHKISYNEPVVKPVVLKSGYLADTHVVDANKAAHFAAVAKAKPHEGYGHVYSGDDAQDHGNFSGGHNIPYYGPVAKPIVLKSGYLADTPEVAAAKAAHLAAVAIAKSRGGHGHVYSGDGSYHEAHYANSILDHGFVAKPVVLKSGSLADTDEMAATKGAHLASVSSPLPLGDNGQGYSGHHDGVYDQGSYSGAHYDHNVPAHGHVSEPVVLNSGYLADTQ